jgi:ubiquinone/menaquinone biosynthesis C-methylase UbiE
LTGWEYEFRKLVNLFTLKKNENMEPFRHKIVRMIHAMGLGFILEPSKAKAELNFWHEELNNYVEWYEGKKLLYGFPAPSEDQKTTEFSLPVNAATTWLNLYQKKKYLVDLELRPESFSGMRLLDVGCGPFPNTLAFENCERHGIEPLANKYSEAGFPINMWSKMGYTHHASPAEKMPFEDNYFDAVMSVNAIDHVDDFEQVASEIKRVLKDDGYFCMHVHYHKPTKCEPLELNDEIFLKSYGWVKNLTRISESNTKDMGLYTAPAGESFVLWSNLPEHLGNSVETVN